MKPIEIKRDKYLVTSALPYANGPLHLGHIAGAYLPADIFVRNAKQNGDEALFISGTDEYGAAISFNAEKEGKNPQEYVDHHHKVIKDYFKKLNIDFDHFSRTTNPYHKDLVQAWFINLKSEGLISENLSRRQYCSECDRFLPDRFVTGECYLCGYEKARGDECPSCSSFLDETQLINPRCKNYNHATELRETKHWQLRLDLLKDELSEWLESKSHWKPNVLGVAKANLETIRPRDITRDLNWGIPVPLIPEAGKVLYVWFDAPIGYISATMEWAAQKHNEIFKAWDWWLGKDTKLVHFIGKDNIIFHTLIWPAMIMGQNKETRRISFGHEPEWALPDNVPANEFYQFEGKKFSTSEGWTVDVDQYPSDYIRWAIVRSLPETKDTEFTWSLFEEVVNTELNNTIGNLFNRIIKGFVISKYEGLDPSGALNEELLKEAKQLKREASKCIYKYQFRKSSDIVMQLGFLANKYIEDNEPWKLYKTDPEKCKNVISTGLELLKLLTEALKSFIPNTTSKMEEILNKDLIERFDNFFEKVEIDG